MFRRATINYQPHELTDALQQHGSQRAAAQALGIPISTFRGQLKRSGQLSENSIQKKEHKDSTTVTARGSAIRTIEELLEVAEVDLSEWEVVEQTVNAWGDDDRQSYQVKCRIRKKLPRSINDGVEILIGKLKDLPKASCKVKAPPPGADKLLVFGLHDLHAAKLAWSLETGSDNYDLNIARQVFANAVDDILAAVSHHSIAKAVLPIGSDLFHSNDSKNRTYSGTPLECDGRHAKVFAEVCDLLVSAVETVGKVCPLYLPLCQGNHDHESSLYAAHVLASRFHNDSNVVVDTTPTIRKYFEYGNNLLCITHGHDIQINSLPLVIATEAAEMWGRCQYREAHIGHYHRAKEVRFVVLDEANGVRVRVNPSLCPPDAWHAAKGFVQSRRAAEGHLYDKHKGYEATYSVNARVC